MDLSAKPQFSPHVHGPVRHVEVRGTDGAPITVSFGRYGSIVTFFMEDHALAADLASAMNAVILRHALRAEELGGEAA